MWRLAYIQAIEINKIMKLTTQLWSLGLLLAATACTPADTGTNAPATASADTASAQPVDYGIPIRYKNWEIGSPDNVKLVLNFYQHWDAGRANEVAGLCADTLRLRLPDSRNEVAVPNSRINEVLGKNRAGYGTTSNEIISAVSLRDKDSGEEWVYTTSYNKWVEKGGRRDSAIFDDNWRVKNGKIEFLMTYQKVPSKAFLQAKKDSSSVF